MNAAEHAERAREMLDAHPNSSEHAQTMALRAQAHATLALAELVAQLITIMKVKP